MLHHAVDVVGFVDFGEDCELASLKTVTSTPPTWCPTSTSTRPFVTVDFGYALGVIRPDFSVIIQSHECSRLMRKRKNPGFPGVLREASHDPPTEG